MNNNNRVAATIYSLGTWFVSGICVWIPCIKEKMMMMMMMIIIIIIIITGTYFPVLDYAPLPEWTKKSAGLSPVVFNVGNM
jgi:hypothetical protein